jgi:transcriptional regulator with XRE-family HTH domain
MRAKPAGRRRRSGPHPVDIHVGMRVRERRTELGISQPELAAALGIAYQQLYKYEQAKNRISASRLYELSEALDVPVAFFFEGLAGTDAKVQKRTKDDQ